MYLYLLLLLPLVQCKPTEDAGSGYGGLENAIIDMGPDRYEVADLAQKVHDLSLEVSRLDMLIKFYNPEWHWTAARECGIDCPYLVDLLDYAAVQWRFQGEADGLFDLEFIDTEGKIKGNMDFYDSHMWLRGCGWVNYIVEEAPMPAEGAVRTWTFAKRVDGFSLYVESTLVLDYTYTEGRCEQIWSGPTNGFYFETPATAVHLLQHEADMFWWQ